MLFISFRRDCVIACHYISPQWRGEITHVFSLFRVATDMSEAAFDAFIDAFLEQAIEANGLAFGGGGRREWKGFVTLERRGSAIDGHRQLVQRWLESQSQIVEYQVGPLVDAWYPA